MFIKDSDTFVKIKDIVLQLIEKLQCALFEKDYGKNKNSKNEINADCF